MRNKNIDWNTGEQKSASYASATLDVLMDIRDEMAGIRSYLASINATLGCRNFLAVPRRLERIAKAVEGKQKAS